MHRYQGMDPRLTMSLAGGAMGVVLAAALFTLRPGIGASGTVLADPAATIAPPPFDVLGPEGLFKAYDTLGAVTVGGSPGTLSVSRADDLVVPSGRIVAADAFFLDTPEFTVKLPAGRHHVLLLHVTAPDFGPRVAAARIRAGEPSPVKWQGAQIAAAAAGAEPFAYGVDSGTGSFASAEAVERFKAMPSDLDTALVDRLLADYKTGGEYRQTATITVDEASGLDIVTFWSGFGDGGYASWFGLDAEGEPVALLTSFDLIDDPTKPTGSPAP